MEKFEAFIMGFVSCFIVLWVGIIIQDAKTTSEERIVEEKTTIIKEENEDYNKIVDNLILLSEKYNDLVRENDKLRQENAEYKAINDLNDFSDAEWIILYRVVRSEAGASSTEGQKNVAKVIFNRMESDLFPNTVEEVVFQKNQFSVVSNGSFYSVEISDFTIENVRTAYLEWLDGDDAEAALFFHSGPGYATTRTFLFEDEVHHKFYK